MEREACVSPRSAGVVVALPIALVVGVSAHGRGKSIGRRRFPAETANVAAISIWPVELGRRLTRTPIVVTRLAPSIRMHSPRRDSCRTERRSGAPMSIPIAWCPGCLIESPCPSKCRAGSTKFSAASPELAKQRLQEADLNYFLFMKDYRIIDLLPFSRLFAPETIGRYLGVKWSDGSTFLLTWIGPDTTPDRARLPRSLRAPARRTGRLGLVQVRRACPADRRHRAAHAGGDAMGRRRQAAYVAMNSVTASAGLPHDREASFFRVCGKRRRFRLAVAGRGSPAVAIRRAPVTAGCRPPPFITS